MKKEVKDQKLERLVVENAPASAVRWLKQPYNLTFLNGEMTSNQLNTLVEIVDVLQGRINTALSTKGTLFSDAEFNQDGVVEVEIPFSALTSNPKKYGEFESIARSMAKYVVEREYVDEEGLPRKRFETIFKSVDIPMSDKGYRKGSIKFSIHRDIIESDTFSLSRYTKYIKGIVKDSKSSFTARLYMFISAWKDLGKWTVAYAELHRILGFTVYGKNPDTGKEGWYVKQYGEYRQFKRRILQTAERELRDLAGVDENGKRVGECNVDCWFDFSEVYPVGKKNGQPEKIVFHIHPTGYGKSNEELSLFAKKRTELESLLRNNFDFKTSDCSRIFKMINEDNIGYALIKAQDIQDYISLHRDAINDIKKYAYKSMQDALADLIPVATETHPEDTAVTNSVSPEPSQDHTAPSLTDSDIQLWNDIVKHFSGTNVSIALEGMSIGRNDKGLIIYAPTKTFVDAFSSAIQQLKDYTGLDIVIQG